MSSKQEEFIDDMVTWLTISIHEMMEKGVSNK